MSATPGPSVSVVVPTRDRPELLRRALETIVGQDYTGDIECVVVFDQSEPDPSIELDEPRRRIRVIRNARTPGLAGSRNSGLLEATGDLVAFCDDDDEWLPGKVSAQIHALRRVPRTMAVGCGMVVHYGDREIVRIPDFDRLTYEMLLADRVTEVNSSTCCYERQWLIDEVGLVDEELPGGYAEDYDLLLRVARRSPILVVREPLSRIYWHQSSFFSERWQMIDDALGYLVDKFPDFDGVPRGLARIRGQQAVARAAMGERRRALSAIGQTLRLRLTEKRAWLALAITSGLVSADQARRLAHHFGRGL